MKHFGLLLLMLVLVACASPGAPDDNLSDRPIRVVTTTGIVGDLVQNIGGERVSVISLMGPGVDPHLYKASARDVIRLQEADIIFYNGLHLEAAMGDVLERMQGRVRTVAVTAGIPRESLLPSDKYENLYDPHIWFDVTLWKQAVEHVRDALIDLDPSSASVYRANADNYIRQLDALHTYALEQSATIPAGQRVLITAHDAFRYFGRAYRFEVRGLQGISTATEAGAADVQALAEFIATRHIPAIFVETSVPQRTIEAVQAAVQERGFTVAIGGELFSDALGTPGTSEGTYIGMVRHNIDTIVRALRGAA
ncbi:MAG: manganese transporter [Roseiflexus castenholzii]|uniref:metal ABC transporter solute-binding protein, Zn/Mn family n=1 Tax=Roseiflexus castenholzii TaxID=120962 RepID=UPI000CB02168|nr:MAG: manganese transporter [Roseiflexus castenholzii]